MFGDDDEAKVDRVMSEYSYRRESDDMWDNLILYLFYAAVAVVGILALLGWLDHQLGWHMKDQFVAWLKGAVQIKAMSAGCSFLPLTGGVATPTLRGSGCRPCNGRWARASDPAWGRPLWHLRGASPHLSVYRC